MWFLTELVTFQLKSLVKASFLGLSKDFFGFKKFKQLVACGTVLSTKSNQNALVAQLSSLPDKTI